MVEFDPNKTSFEVSSLKPIKKPTKTLKTSSTGENLKSLVHVISFVILVDFLLARVETISFASAENEEQSTRGETNAKLPKQ